MIRTIFSTRSPVALRRDALFHKEVVLHADADMAAQEEALGTDGKLIAPRADDRPLVVSLSEDAVSGCVQVNEIIGG